MPEHIPLLVSEPRRKNLSAAMKAFKQAVSRRALARRKRDGGWPTLGRVAHSPRHHRSMGAPLNA
jgi:hypothetical protein